MNAAQKIRKAIDRAQSADECREIVERMIKVVRTQKRLRSERAPKVAGATKDERREERNIRLKVAREVAEARAGGKCEVCGRTGFILQAHHLVSGGLRRHRESAETLLMICADDHRAIHRGDLDTLRSVKEATIRLGMREGLRAIDRRIERVEEARRTPSVPVKVVVR